MGLYARMIREQMFHYGVRWMSAPRPYFWGLPCRYEGPPFAALGAPPPHSSESEEVIVISDSSSDESILPSSCSTVAGVPVTKLQGTLVQLRA